MGGFMTGSQLGVKVGWRVGIFLALTIGFPFIVYGLIVATGARGVGGAAGAVVVAAGVCGAFCVAMAATTYFVAQGKQRTFAPGAAKPAIATFRRA
jgi:hypothetical protein